MIWECLSGKVLVAHKNIMIRISSNLAEGAVATVHHLSGKTALFSQLSALAGTNYGLDPAVVQDGLEERERLGSTGFGGGTAIPHCKISGLESPVCVVLRLDKPLEYDAVDDLGVDMIIGLISPSHDGAAHLRALAEISRMFRNEKFCAQLRGAADSDAIYALLTLSEARDAA